MSRKIGGVVGVNSQVNLRKSFWMGGLAVASALAACGGSTPPSAPVAEHKSAPVISLPQVLDAGPVADSDAGAAMARTVAPPTTIAAHQGVVTAVAVDGPWVYWLNAAGVIKRGNTAGGPSFTVADVGPEAARSLSVAAGNAYSAVVSSKTKSITVFRTNADLANKPESIGGSPSRYFAFLGADKVSTVWGSLDTNRKLTLFALQSGQKTAHALPPVDASAPGTHVGLTSTDAYFCDGGKINSVSLKTGKLTTTLALNGDTQMIVDFAIAGDRVYASVWDADHGDIGTVKSTSIISAPLGGGAPNVLLHEDRRNVFSLVADASNLYYVDREMPASTGTTDGNIMKLPLGGGAPVPLVTHQKYPNAVALDDDSVFWTAEIPNALTTDGSIFKIAK